MPSAQIGSKDAIKFAERTITVVEERIQAAASDEERGRWVRFREGITGTGRDLLVDVLGAVITRQFTGG